MLNLKRISSVLFILFLIAVMGCALLTFWGWVGGLVMDLWSAL